MAGLAAQQDQLQRLRAVQLGSNRDGRRLGATRTPEAQGLNLYTPGHTRTLTWTSPVTNKMLLEAGWGNYLANYANDAPRIDGLHNPALISVLEQTGVATPRPGPCSTAASPNLTYRFDNPLGGGFQHHQIGTLANLKASVSYITGAHNMKFGYMGGFSNPSQAYYNFTPFVQYRFSGGVPNQLTQTAQFGGTGAVGRRIRPQPRADVLLRAGSVDHASRLTLQGGVRYDHILTSYPDACVGGPDYPLMPTQICYPARSTDGRALERRDAAHRRRLRPVRQRQDGREGEPREIHAGAHGEQQRHGSQPADPH